MNDPQAMQPYRAGVDIGGTFTDVVLATADGRVAVHKLLSTPRDYSLAVLEGVLSCLQTLGNDPGNRSELVHATTVATNAIVQHRGAECALITTEGFRDVLEIGRLRIPALYDFAYDKRRLLVPRSHVFELRERITSAGTVDVALDLEQVAQVVAQIAALGVQSVAVCLLNAFANSAHETAVAKAFSDGASHLDVSVSNQILPRIGEYERTSTTVVNAYVMPTVRRYLRALEARLRGKRVQGPILIMRSGGGVMRLETAVREPVHMVESGPAAGVLAAQRLFGAGSDNLLTFDVGGTTAKASVIEGGALLKTFDYEVGGAMAATARLTGGGGYPIQIPVIDIAEVGAGGGSVVWVDHGGSLRVGPHSAGAAPGPVCYDLGGREVTVTDANLLLGYLNPESLAGGLTVRPRLAEAAMLTQVAEPLSITLPEAAYGVHRIANSQMMGAVRAVSTERGRDLRAFTLVAFGGNGPIHAASLAAELGIATVIVPPAPGLFSATGLLVTDLEHHAIATLYRNLPDLAVAELNRFVDRLADRVRAMFTDDGIDIARVRLEMSLDMRYSGQNSDLSVVLPLAPFDAKTMRELSERFGAEHERTFGHRAATETVVLVQLQVLGRASPELASASRDIMATMGSEPHDAGRESTRPAYFGPRLGYVNCRVIGRHGLSRAKQAGPLLIEEFDSVTVVPPGFGARVDESRNIVLEADADDVRKPP